MSIHRTVTRLFRELLGLLAGFLPGLPASFLPSRFPEFPGLLVGFFPGLLAGFFPGFPGLPASVSARSIAGAPSSSSPPR
jgi:hypothetical protein